MVQLPTDGGHLDHCTGDRGCIEEIKCAQHRLWQGWTEDAFGAIILDSTFKLL